MTSSGFSALASAASAACTLASEARGTSTARTCGAAGRSLPANIFSTWRLRYQRSIRSAIDVPLPAASVYHWRIEASS